VLTTSPSIPRSTKLRSRYPSLLATSTTKLRGQARVCKPTLRHVRPNARTARDEDEEKHGNHGGQGRPLGLSRSAAILRMQDKIAPAGVNFASGCLSFSSLSSAFAMGWDPRSRIMCRSSAPRDRQPILDLPRTVFLSDQKFGIEAKRANGRTDFLTVNGIHQTMTSGRSSLTALGSIIS
jgi:hypothetical protein